MITWKYTDETHLVVSRTLDNGSSESCLVSAITDWIAEGNTPTPADIPPEPTYQELRAVAYPSIPDQLDLLYHGGLVGWKEAIDVVKTKYPKGT